MEFQVIRPSQLRFALMLVLIVSASLTMGFIPSSRGMAHWAIDTMTQLPQTLKPLLLNLSFPFFALLFHLSIPREKGQPKTLPPRSLTRSLLLPLLMVLLFGAFLPGKISPDSLISQKNALLWLIVFAPVGEELLFRGWFFKLLYRLFKDKAATYTNPAPVCIWATALAFSFWHLQNFNHASVAFICFQLLYTFCTGLWLGWIRFHTKSVLTCISIHMTLNFFTNLI